LHEQTIRGPTGQLPPTDRPTAPLPHHKGIVQKPSPLGQAPMNIASSDCSSSPVSTPGAIPAQHKSADRSTPQQHQQLRKSSAQDGSSSGVPSPSMAPMSSARTIPQKRKDATMLDANEAQIKRVQSTPPTRPSPATQASVHVLIDSASQPDERDRRSSTLDNAIAHLPASTAVNEVELDRVPQVLVQQIMSWAEKSAIERAKVQEQARITRPSKKSTS
jgi:hypothetical protein